MTNTEMIELLEKIADRIGSHRIDFEHKLIVCENCGEIPKRNWRAGVFNLIYCGFEIIIKAYKNVYNIIIRLANYPSHPKLVNVEIERIISDSRMIVVFDKLFDKKQNHKREREEGLFRYLEETVNNDEKRRT